jgi:tetratricopeptide (TPR) repeat protein
MAPEVKPAIQQYLTALAVEPEDSAALEALEEIVTAGNGAGDPLNHRALAEARQLHLVRGDVELAVRLLDLEIALENDADRRASLLFEKGNLLCDELRDEAQALSCFEQVVAQRPSDQAAKDKVEQISLVRGNWRKIVDKYLEEASNASDRGLSAALYLSAAELYFKNAPDMPEAEANLRRSLEIEPGSREALQLLERLLKRAGRSQELVAVYDGRLEAAQSREERLQVALAAARLHTHLGNADRALESYRRVIGIEPAHPRALAHLADHFNQEQDWNGLIRLYENALRASQVAGARPNADLETGMCLQIGILQWRMLNNLDAAEEFFRRVRKSDPAHPAMLDFYRQYYGSRNEGAKLLQLLQGAQKAAPAADVKVALAVEIAQVAEAKAGNVEKAIDVWKGLLRSGEAQGQGEVAQRLRSEATAALKRLYRETEKWNALLELLKEEAQGASGVAAKVERYFEMVSIYRDELKLDVMVINTFNQILALDPQNGPALAALAERYEAMGRWNDLIGVLQRQAQVKSEPVERIALLQRVAKLWIDRFSNPNQAVKPLEEILSLSAELGQVDPDSLARLKDIYQRRRNWRGLLDLYRREVEVLGGQEQQRLLQEMAKLAVEKLDSPREAIVYWNRVLEYGENDGEALSQLEVLYERERRWPALIEMLTRKLKLARAAGERPAQLAVLTRLALLHADQLKLDERALELWREILGLEPENLRARRWIKEHYVRRGAWDELEALYADRGSWEEFVDVLTQATDRAPQTPTKIALYLRIARTYEQRLHQRERAAKAYERILSLSPDHPDSARALVPIYQEGEKWARLLPTYEILLGHAGSLPERLEILRDIRQLCERRLSSKGLAFQWCTRAFALTPEDPELQAELERLADEADAWEELSELYQKRVARLGEAEETAIATARTSTNTEAADAAAAAGRLGESITELLRRLASIAMGRLHKLDDARGFFEELLARHPEDAVALATLEQIFTQTQKWPELVQIYRRRRDLAGSDERRLELLFKTAYLEEERLNDLGAAVQSYRRILDIDGENHRALRALMRLHHVRAEWNDLAEVLKRELALEPNSELQVTLHFQLGSLYQEALDDAPRAIGQFQEALKKDSVYRQAVIALERYLLDPRYRLGVARTLEPFYDRTGDLVKLAQTLEIQQDEGFRDGASGAPPRSEDAAKARLKLLARLGTLYSRRLGDLESAFLAFARMFELDPADPVTWRELDLLADRLGNHAELASIMSAGRGQLRGDSAIELEVELGHLYEEKLDPPRVEQAEQAWRNVLLMKSDHLLAYHSLERLLTVNERWPALLELYRERADRTVDPAEKRELLSHMSDLYEGVLDDLPGAINVYREVLELDAADRTAHSALDRLYLATSRWQDLADHLERLLAYVTDRAQVADLCYRRAELLEHQLGAPDRAVDLYHEVIARAPNHRPALEALERLMQDKAHRGRVARLLETIYQSQGNAAQLVQSLRAQRETAAESGDEITRLELTSRIAELCETRLSQPDLAFDAWREAVALDPTFGRGRQELDRLGTQLQRFAALVEAWQAALSKVSAEDRALHAELLERLARLHEDRLGDDHAAEQCWRKLLELDPADRELTLLAASYLERLYGRHANAAQLVAILRLQLEMSDEAEERRTLLRRIATLEEESLDQVDAAIETYQRLHDVEPPDSSQQGFALAALERLYRQENRPTELRETLRRRLPLLTDADDRRRFRMEIAALSESVLREPEEAIVSYQTVLTDNPDDLEALEALSRLYEASDRWVDLHETLERRLELAHDAPAQVALLQRIGELALQKLSDPEAAINRWEAAIQTSLAAQLGEHPPAVTAVEALLNDERVRLRAAEVLRPIYERTARWEKLIGIHELLAGESSDTSEQLRLRLTIAALTEQRLGNPAQAYEHYTNALREGRSDARTGEIMGHLERLAVALQRPLPLVELYSQIALELADGDLQLRALQHAANQAYQVLGERQRALGLYRRILEIAPEHTLALDRLESIYAELADWESLLELYGHRAELATDLESRRSYRWKAAVLCEERLSRPSHAIGHYEAVLELVPEDLQAIIALERLYQADARWQDLAHILEKQIGFGDDIAQVVALHYRLGELYELRLGEKALALEHYRAALSGDAGHESTVVALERLLEDPEHRAGAAEALEPIYGGNQQWDRLIRIYEIRLDAASDPMERLLIGKRLGRIHEEQKEDLDGAFTWYSRVFRDEPTDSHNLDTLTRLANVLDRWADLAELLASYFDATMAEDDPTLRIGQLLGRVYDERLHALDKAEEVYRRLVSSLRARNDQRPARQPGSLIWTFDRLEDLLDRAEHWAGLLEIYREAADATDPSDDGDHGKRALLYKMCAVQEHRLQNHDRAIDGYLEILALDDNDARAVSALDRLYQSQSRWSDLAELLRREIEKAAPAARVELRLRLAQVHEDRLGDLPGAIDCYEELLVHPMPLPQASTPAARDALMSFDPAGTGRALSALERLVLDEGQRLRIAHILEPLYKETDEWAKLVVIYDAQLEFLEDKADRVVMLREIATLQEQRGGHLELAFAALGRAFTEAFGDPDLMSEMERLAGLLGNWSELVARYEAGLDDIYDAELLSRMHSTVARLYETRLSSDRQAVGAWRKLLGVKDDDGDALAALERLYVRLDEPRDLIEILERQAEQELSDPVRRRGLLARVAELWESRLSDLDQSVAVWRRVLEIDPTDAEALDHLDDLLARTKHWSDLIDIYQRKLDALEPEPATAHALRLAIGQVYEERLDDAMQAIGAYRTALDHAPGPQAQLTPLQALDRLHLRERQWPELDEILGRQVELADSAETRIGLLYRRARLCERDLSDLDRAIEGYGAVLKEQPQHAGARGALEGIARGESHRMPAADVLEPLYRAHREWGALIALEELRLEATTDTLGRVALLRSIAHLAEEGLGDLRAGFKAEGRALAEDPADETIHMALHRLGEKLHAWDDLAALYEARIKDVLDQVVLRGLVLRLARLHENERRDDGAAIQQYRRALDEVGDDEEPLTALDRLYLRTGRWTELADIINREISASTDVDHTVELYYRLGHIAETAPPPAGGDPSRALASYREAVARTPGHPATLQALHRLLGSSEVTAEVLEVLEPHYQEVGDATRQAEMCEVRLTITREPVERVALLERLAELLERQLGEPQAAFRALCRAARELPDEMINGRLYAELSRLADTGNWWSELLQLGEELLADLTGRAGRDRTARDLARDLGLKLAEAALTKLRDPARSERRLHAVLELEPENLVALSALESLYRNAPQGMVAGAGRLADVLDRLAQVDYNLPARKARYAEIARLAEGPLGDVGRAIRAYHTLAEIDEADAAPLRELARLYELSGDDPALIDTLERLGQFADDTELKLLKRRVANLLRRSGITARAIEAYRDLADLAPTDMEPLRALEELYAKASDWRALEEVLVRQVSVLQGLDQVPVRRRLAELSEKQLGSPDGALDHYRSILEMHAAPPDEEAARREVLRLLESLDRNYDLVELLKEEAQRAASRRDTKAELQLLTRAAGIWESKLQNPESAAELLAEVLKRDPDHVEATRGIARLYELSSEWEKAVAALERAARLFGRGPDAAAALVRAGKIKATELWDAEGAEKAFAAALEQDPASAAALEELKKSARERGDIRRLAELSEREAAAAPTTARRIELLIETSRLYLEQLKDPARGVLLLEQAQSLDGENPQIALLLADLYFAAGQWDRARSAYTVIVDKTSRGGKRTKDLARYHARLGQVAERQGDKARAMTHFQAANQIDATEPSTLVALGRMAYEEKDWEKARKMYRSMLLLPQVEREAGVSKADVYYYLGMIHVALNETPKAASMFERGLEVDKAHAACKQALTQVRGR